MSGFLVPGLVIGLFGLELAAADIGAQYMQVTMGTGRRALSGILLANGCSGRHRKSAFARTSLYFTAPNKVDIDRMLA